MGRRQRRGGRSGGKARGGAMSSLRGGFRSAVNVASGQRAPASARGRTIGNVVSIVLLALAVLFLLYRFGVFR
jgi:hypothetical protein